VVLVAAFASIWITDIARWFRLNRLVANLAAVTAVVFTFYDALRLQGDARLAVIANLLVVLQVILFFQEKDARVYGQLAMLCLLEVVVATLFNSGLWFGILLVLELVVGLWTLLLLHLVRQWRQQRGSSPSPTALPARHEGPAARRWPLEAEYSGFAPGITGGSRLGLGGELLRRVANMVCVSLLISVIVFFFLPRLGHTAWRGPGTRCRTIGFSDTITLGELGEVLQSRDEVLRLRLTDERTGQVYPLRGEVYLRGAVLSRYEQGRWSQPTSGAFSHGRRKRSLEPSLADRAPMVLQYITIEPLDRPELFCLWPFVELGPIEGIYFDVRLRRLLRNEEFRTRRFSFRLGTTALEDGVQQPWTPCLDAVEAEEARGPLLALPHLPRLRALAAQWLAASGLPAHDRLGQARWLEGQFGRSGRFRYTLEPQPRNPKLDPIEDFLSEHPAGHCEYFATALALMLRSQGIPARIMVGYRCDEWNALGQFFQVRQLHAHSWVEAYFGFEELPAALQTGEDTDRWRYGGWLRLDPAPASALPERSASFPAQLRGGLDWLQYLWLNYVVELEQRRQQETIYRPIGQAARSFYHGLRGQAWWGGLREGWQRLRQRGGLWLACLLGLMGLGLLAGAVGWAGVWLARRIARCFRPPAARVAFSRAIEVEFYRRLEALLARWGLQRTAGQTQFEFAQLAAARLAAQTNQPGCAELPLHIVQAYYRVRFGGLSLDARQAILVEAALARLGTALVAAPRPPEPQDTTPAPPHPSQKGLPR
jgi:hypothetical protein